MQFANMGLIIFSATSLQSPTQTKSLSELLLNKHGIHIPQKLDFGQVQLGQPRYLDYKQIHSKEN